MKKMLICLSIAVALVLSGCIQSAGTGQIIIPLPANAAQSRAGDGVAWAHTRIYLASETGVLQKFVKNAEGVWEQAFSDAEGVTNAVTATSADEQIVLAEVNTGTYFLMASFFQPGSNGLDSVVGFGGASVTVAKDMDNSANVTLSRGVFANLSEDETRSLAAPGGKLYLLQGSESAPTLFDYEAGVVVPISLGNNQKIVSLSTGLRFDGANEGTVFEELWLNVENYGILPYGSTGVDESFFPAKDTLSIDFSGAVQITYTEEGATTEKTIIIPFYQGTGALGGSFMYSGSDNPSEWYGLDDLAADSELGSTLSGIESLILDYDFDSAKNRVFFNAATLGAYMIDPSNIEDFIGLIDGTTDAGSLKISDFTSLLGNSAISLPEGYTVSKLCWDKNRYLYVSGKATKAADNQIFAFDYNSDDPQAVAVPSTKGRFIRGFASSESGYVAAMTAGDLLIFKDGALAKSYPSYAGLPALPTGLIWGNDGDGETLYISGLGGVAAVKSTDLQ